MKKIIFLVLVNATLLLCESQNSNNQTGPGNNNSSKVINKSIAHGKQISKTPRFSA